MPAESVYVSTYVGLIYTLIITTKLWCGLWEKSDNGSLIKLTVSNSTCYLFNYFKQASIGDVDFVAFDDDDGGDGEYDVVVVVLAAAITMVGQPF